MSCSPVAPLAALIGDVNIRLVVFSLSFRSQSSSVQQLNLRPMDRKPLDWHAACTKHLGADLAVRMAGVGVSE